MPLCRKPVGFCWSKLGWRLSHLCSCRPCGFLLAAADLQRKSRCTIKTATKGRQWLPIRTIRCVDHKQGSSPCSHPAAARIQQGNGGLDADTAAAGATMQLPTMLLPPNETAHSMSSSQAADVSFSKAFRDSIEAHKLAVLSSTTSFWTIFSGQ